MTRAVLALIMVIVVGCLGLPVLLATAVPGGADACVAPTPARRSVSVPPVDPCADVSSLGWTPPVRAPIVSAFRTPDRPGHDGVDLGAARHVPIRAAAAGTVLRVRCNIHPLWWGCDRDGNPDTPGCGWYLDVLHAGQVITRYCHLVARPLVGAGERVAVGQVIGYVGSSGHSSGPHLHFEVRLRGDAGPAGAVDPVGWMRDHGAPLGR
jgi:murein DD-endopeptidase MepM/ murein hydrolase activator NlpD